MNVFVLCTGRSGSTTFIEACKHITNYTAGHETRSKIIDHTRFDYPDNHIEGDNRLSWFLGALDEKYGDNAYYVHLIRDKEPTIASFGKRWKLSGSIIKAFSEGILMQQGKRLSDIEKKNVASQYYDTVNSNIRAFLKDKTHTTTIRLETIEEGFTQFWKDIGAEGEIDMAVKTLGVQHNVSKITGFLKKWVK